MNCLLNCLSAGCGDGEEGPGPDPFGLAWGARVLGRTLLVWLGGPGSWAGPFWFGLGGQGPGPGPAYTINTLDSDKDVNINTFHAHDLFMMLI